MSTLAHGPCTPWTTEARVLAHPAVCRLPEAPAPAHIARMIEVASWLLYERTGRRWSGRCTDIVTVSDDWCRCSCPPFYGWDRRRWLWRQPHICACRTGPALRVGDAPLRSVEKVTVDGVDLDPGDYRLEDYRWLVRLGSGDWSYADQVVVEYTFGQDPPAAGELAAAVLAAELLLASFPGAPCRLPGHVQSVARQNISMSWNEPTVGYLDGLTGISEVDLFLTAQRGQQRRSRVLIPEGLDPLHRMT